MIISDDFLFSVRVRQKRSFERSFTKEEIIELLEDLEDHELKDYGLTPGWQDQPMTKEHFLKIYDALEHVIYLDDYDLVVNNNEAFHYDHSFLEPSFYVGEDPHDLNT